MIYNTPERFTTLHLAQRFLIDDVTFMIAISFLTEHMVQVLQLFISASRRNRRNTAKVAIIPVL